MSNDARLSMYAAAIGKMGVTSVFGGYSAADTFLEGRSDAVRQRTCQGCVFHGERFSACHTVSSYWPQKFTEATEMGPQNLFWGKRPLRKKFKISLQNNSCEQWFTYSCQVSWKLVKWKWPNRCHDNRFVFEAISPKNLWDHSFFISRSSAKFRPIPSSFRGDMCENVTQTHYNIADNHFLSNNRDVVYCNSLQATGY